MPLKRIILFSFFFLHYVQINAQTINSSLSRVDFEISNFRVNTVEGFFSEMRGTVNFNEEELSTSNFDVCISTQSINTDNEKRDDHLRNEDFFDVEKFPTICYKSNEILKKGDGFITNGTLTIHGVTKEISFFFIKNDLLLEGSFKIKRLDFDLGKDTGTFTVGNEVSVKIKCALQGS